MGTWGLILLFSLHLRTFEIVHNKTNPRQPSRRLRLQSKVPRLAFKVPQDLPLPHFSSSPPDTHHAVASLGTQLSPEALSLPVCLLLAEHVFPSFLPRKRFLISWKPHANDPWTGIWDTFPGLALPFYLGGVGGETAYALVSAQA